MTPTEHLEAALEEADDPEARFRIRQALQHLKARSYVKCNAGP